MLISKKAETAAGILFFTAMFSYISGDMLVSGFVWQVQDTNKNLLICGIIFELINCFSAIGISILLYPVLKAFSNGIAIAYIVSRTVEAVLLIFAGLSPLILMNISTNFDISYFLGENQVIIMNEIFTNWYILAYQMGMIALGAGSIMMCIAFYKTKVIPTFIAILGLAGYAMLFTNSWLALFGYGSDLFYIPGGAFEIVFPLWLIFKGFNECIPANKE